MKSIYIKHSFGEAVQVKLSSKLGWLTAGVASSIAWPLTDVCIHYDGEDYFIRGSELNGKSSPPCITIAYMNDDVDAAISKIYKLTSVLGWYLGGYVDVSGYMFGTHPILYGNPLTVYSKLGLAGKKSFNCNYMPIIEDEKSRIALAFWREGQKLRNIHDGFSFLSFYKVIESQFKTGDKSKISWFSKAIVNLSGRAADRVKELISKNIDVSKYLFESCRCAVAHASFEGHIVDPDIPADRKRLKDDLVVIEELARVYIKDELRVPDSHYVFIGRNRLLEWNSLLSEATIKALMSGGAPYRASKLAGKRVSIGLWSDGIIDGLENMNLVVEDVNNGKIRIALLNEWQTIGIVFILDYLNGRAHTQLDKSGLIYGKTKPSEADARAFATYFYNVLGNERVELYIDNLAPVDCEIVIPVNILPPNPATAIENYVTTFIKENKTH